MAASSPSHSSIAMVLMNFCKTDEVDPSTSLLARRQSTVSPMTHLQSTRARMTDGGTQAPPPPLKRHKSHECMDEQVKEDTPRTPSASSTSQRTISMEKIRVNLMKRRDKLTHEKHERSLLIDSFHQAQAHAATSRGASGGTAGLTHVALAPRPEAPSSSSSIPPMSMHSILSTLPNQPLSSVYLTDTDIIGSAADAARGLICRYSTGKCKHLRAQKADGSYLNLCHLHRVRANANQRKLDRKKSWKSVSTSSSAASSPRSSSSTCGSNNHVALSEELLALVRRIVHHKPGMTQSTWTSGMMTSTPANNQDEGDDDDDDERHSL
ncbi:Aste57867_9237 [Aphanomyces stellatus]|uniref:Aste57867_9237 protein n=1 Tax=Aphanomyces stellatus TaxID=120398 RepID=A0A485KMA4_9STRA|nr:hypothetical protein As57867_009201 [Aphanomyces stellatus]VFT86120.1 Aste57867_9237 [Aphanomyces stellatus]